MTDASNITVSWLHGQVWSTRPSGLLIFALPDRVTVESGGRLLIGLGLRRPEAMVLIDKAVLTLPSGPTTYHETEMTPSAARAWAAKATVRSPQGVLELGEQMLAAWDHHALLYREALARGPGLVVLDDGGLQ